MAFVMIHKVQLIVPLLLLARQMMEHAMLIPIVLICKHVILLLVSVVALKIHSCLQMLLNAQFHAIKTVTVKKITFAMIEHVLKHHYLLVYVKFTKIVMLIIRAIFRVFVH
jgi:hypothetical protein